MFVHDLDAQTGAADPLLQALELIFGFDMLYATV
jgi:hypothetical protein